MKQFVHGTYAGYQRHTREGSEPCEECRKASAAYMRKYREQRPADYEHERQQQNARSRALTRLAQKYPGVYRRLVDEERKASA